MKKISLVILLLAMVGSLFGDLTPAMDKNNGLMLTANSNIWQNATYPNTVDIKLRSKMHKLVGKNIYFQLIKFSCKGEDGVDYYYEKWFFAKYDETKKEFVYVGSLNQEEWNAAYNCWLIEVEKSYCCDIETGIVSDCTEE